MEDGQTFSVTPLSFNNLSFALKTLNMKEPINLKSMSKHNVPLDVWTNILSRLPVKSVLRFRRVSKPWKSLIDESSFCRLHLHNFKNNRDETRLFSVEINLADCKREETCAVRSCRTFKTTAILGPLDTVKFGGRCVLLNAVDGLVMIKYGSPWIQAPELMLWNPSIKRTRRLPQSPAVSGELRNFDLGIGFSPSINDYKHVRLVLGSDYDTLCSVFVYTVGTGLWKSIEFQDTGISDWRCTSLKFSKLRVVCCRGALYFTSSCRISGGREKLELVSFDLCDEVFAFTVLPKDECGRSDETADKFVTLLDGGCSLGVVYLLLTKGCIWGMESSGSWVKRHVFSCEIQEISPDKYNFSGFLCMNKNQQMFLEWNGRFCDLKLSSYNLDTGEEEFLVTSPCSLMHSLCIYKESLVLLNG